MPPYVSPTSRTMRAKASKLAGALEHALHTNEISTAFQTKVALATGKVVGLEALARWDSSIFGRMAPETFIPIAETHGLIADVTRKVLRDALAVCAHLRAAVPDMTVAVNFSPLLLDSQDLVSSIDRALAESDLPPFALVAEITESHAIAHLAQAGRTLACLRDRGIACSIDDFGTGHASLLSLLRLPFNELKIDRAFIAACDTDREAAKIVRATLGLAQEMDLHVVAEGIESAAVEALLRDLGCSTGQGFRYGRPMTGAALHQALASASADRAFTA